MSRWVEYDDGEAPWSENEQFGEQDKACAARCKRWGKSGCPRPDHTCTECQYDAEEVLRAKYPESVL